jgi:16S rRNA (guanine(966)-N(2))-methyltransferase RsmD
MRVIAGEAKGLILKAVPGKGTRPISDRVKESLFNILGRRVVGCHFLDLFAGTGSVGIEALSQGAERAVFIERAWAAVRVIRENLVHTGLDEWAEVLHMDVFDFVPRCEEQFDIVYVAPPQYRGLWSDTLALLDQHPLLTRNGLIVVQIFPKEFEPQGPERYSLVDQRTYGSTLLCFYEHKQRDSGEAEDMPTPSGDRQQPDRA